MTDYDTSKTFIYPAEFFGLAIFIIILTSLHYATMGSKVQYHTLFRELYFIPIFYVSFRHGWKPGLFIALLVSCFYLPHVYLTWGAQPGVNVGNLFQIPIFILVALFVGLLSDREKQRQRRMRQNENLVALGRATLAIEGELQEFIRELKASLLKLQLDDVHQELENVVSKIVALERALHQFKPERSRIQEKLIEPDLFLKRISRSVYKKAKAKNIILTVESESNPCSIRGQEAELLWVVEQLITNALDASPPGSRITITARQEGNSCRISVIDQGKGIAPEDLPKIFVPFYTTKRKGTGLGLAVCKKVVRDNNGEITVESKVGEGTTFSLFFPCAFSFRSAT